MQFCEEASILSFDFLFFLFNFFLLLLLWKLSVLWIWCILTSRWRSKITVAGKGTTRRCISRKTSSGQLFEKKKRKCFHKLNSGQIHSRFWCKVLNQFLLLHCSLGVQTSYLNVSFAGGCCLHSFSVDDAHEHRWGNHHCWICSFTLGSLAITWRRYFSCAFYKESVHTFPITWYNCL